MNKIIAGIIVTILVGVIGTWINSEIFNPSVVWEIQKRMLVCCEEPSESNILIVKNLGYNVANDIKINLYDGGQITRLGKFNTIDIDVARVNKNELVLNIPRLPRGIYCPIVLYSDVDPEITVVYDCGFAKEQNRNIEMEEQVFSCIYIKDIQIK